MTAISTFFDLKYNYQPIGLIPDNQFSPLMLAARQGDSEKMEILLSQTNNLDQICFHDAFCLAAMMGHVKIIELMIEKGVNPNPNRSYDVFKNTWHERLTAMGHAIQNRHGSVIEVLLKHGMKVEEVSREKENSDSPLDLFFSKHTKSDNNLDVLRLILSNGAKVHSLQRKTIFKIAVLTSAAELAILIDAGFDPKSKYSDEQNPEKKGKDRIFYHQEINILDLSVMQAEMANVFKEDIDAINKVALLVQKGANPLACNNFWSQNYLHQVSLPPLIKLFGGCGVDVKSSTIFQRHSEDKICPIDYANTQEAVNLLCTFGEEKEHAPFIKDTQAHNRALARIGFVLEKGLKQLDESGDLLLMKAYKKHDIAAFVALIGEGIDVNQKKENGAGWTCLHRLFSEINRGSVNEEYDFTTIATDCPEVRLINMLIKHGAAPLKDAIGRTPLMCLSFNPFNIVFNRQVIDTYIDFEAVYYQLDPKEYREKFFQLRNGGFTSQETFLGGSAAVPIQSVFERFWQSFETHEEFNPKESHNPTADWNRMRKDMEGKGY